MKRKHLTQRMPRMASKLALVVTVLLPFLLMGCTSLDKAHQLVDVVSQVCEIVDNMQRCFDISDHYQ